jgi:hypothetical protein
MAWFGGTKTFDKAPDGSEINPFAPVDHFSRVVYFTDGLKKNLQWIIMQPEDDNSEKYRGNLPYSRQNQKPDWLSKTEWLSFANMRSHPNTQIRNILIAFEERQLPFNNACVQMLIRQSLFQIGAVSVDRSSAALNWKQDLNRTDFCQDASTTLKSFYNEIKDTPKNYQCVNLLGELCNFFAAWDPSCRRVARELAKSVHGWAEDAEEDVDKSLPSFVSEIRSKQVVLYQNAIMVLAGGILDESDVELLIKMLIKTKNLYTGDNREDEIRRNRISIQYTLSKQVDVIVDSATRQSSIITTAFRSFFTRCPSKLEWKRWAPSSNKTSNTQCFCAKYNGTCYSVNVVTGEVLINGLPPSRLPQSILKNPLYIRCFSDRQFEVMQKDGMLETCRPAFGRFYRFSLGSSLKVYEYKDDGSEMMELLDATNNLTDAPPRLTKMHSHWLYRLILLKIKSQSS